MSSLIEKVLRWSDGSVVTFGYDKNNRLKTITDGEESGYVYNALGRRIKNTGERIGILTETEYTADDIGGVWNGPLTPGYNNLPTQ